MVQKPLYRAYYCPSCLRTVRLHHYFGDYKKSGAKLLCRPYLHVY